METYWNIRTCQFNFECTFLAFKTNCEGMLFEKWRLVKFFCFSKTSQKQSQIWTVLVKQHRLHQCQMWASFFTHSRLQWNIWRWTHTLGEFAKQPSYREDKRFSSVLVSEQKKKKKTSSQVPAPQTTAPLSLAHLSGEHVQHGDTKHARLHV